MINISWKQKENTNASEAESHIHITMPLHMRNPVDNANAEQIAWLNEEFQKKFLELIKSELEREVRANIHKILVSYATGLLGHMEEPDFWYRAGMKHSLICAAYYASTFDVEEDISVIEHVYRFANLLSKSAYEEIMSMQEQVWRLL